MFTTWPAVENSSAVFGIHLCPIGGLHLHCSKPRDYSTFEEMLTRNSMLVWLQVMLINQHYTTRNNKHNSTSYSTLLVTDLHQMAVHYSRHNDIQCTARL